ncbi:unnamed protein product [Caenorhabditis brenneri]
MESGSTPASNLPKNTSGTPEKQFWIAELPELISEAKSFSLLLIMACVALFILKIAMNTTFFFITNGDLTWLAISIFASLLQSVIFALQLRARVLLLKFGILEVNRAYHYFFWTTSFGSVLIVAECFLVLGLKQHFGSYWMFLFPIIETPILLYCLFIIEFRITAVEEALFENYKIEREIGEGKLSEMEEKYLEDHRPGLLISNSYGAYKHKPEESK